MIELTLESLAARVTALEEAVLPAANGNGVTKRSTRAAEKSFDRLEHYKDIIGCLDGLPADAAQNHDHYLYGSPKQLSGTDPT